MKKIEKITRNHLTTREIETILLGVIEAKTKIRYEDGKTYIMQSFTKENIEKITDNVNGSFTKVDATTITVEEAIKEAKEEIKKQKAKIAQLETLDKSQVLIKKNEYIKRHATKETEEKAEEYIRKMLEDFTSKTLKQ